MEKRWYAVWPQGVPKTCEVEKPPSEYIAGWARITPDSTALRFYGHDMSYKELDKAINRFAHGLMALGIKKGDRVALHMQNCPQFVISFFGILREGAIVVPLNPMFKHAELEYEFNDSQATALVGLDILYPEIAKIRDRLSIHTVILTSLQDFLPENPVIPIPPDAREAKVSFPDTIEFTSLINDSGEDPICNVDDLKEDLAILQYTGGTTGIPKAAMITHYNLACAAMGYTYWKRLREDDVVLGVTPFFHVMGMAASMCGTLFIGAQLVILSRFDPEVTAMALSHYKCTNWVAATTMVIALFNLSDLSKYDFSSLRYLWSGGSPISLELLRKMHELVPKASIGEGYGLTECVAHSGTVTPFMQHRPGFAGIPHLNDVKIVDLEKGGEELPPNMEGEIVIKGPTVMKGYWNKPQETANTLKDGWLYTGDIGVMDEKGYLKIVGRKKELILCSGFNVFPYDVEDLLYKHPAVREVAVIGVPDPYRGESPKAFIVINEEFRGKIKEEEILEWCKENMAAYKRPRFIEFREDLPKSAAGKLLRRLLIEEQNNNSASKVA